MSAKWGPYPVRPWNVPRRTLADTRDWADPFGLPRPHVHVHTARKRNPTPPGFPPPYDYEQEEAA